MRHRLAGLGFGLALGLAGTGLLAGEWPRPFVTGSYTRILAAHPDRPLVLTFWSLDCAHCLEELPRLGAWTKRHPRAAVVLVSTDTPDDAGAIGAVLRAQGLGRKESWVFADELPERLRHEIDPRWRGELPRTVLRGRDGRLRALTGRLDPVALERWLAEQRGLEANR